MIPKFAYHGLNTYAYLLSRYREYVDPDNDDIRGETFDFVTIQLYEGYSHAQYKIFVEKQPADLVLVEFVKMVTQCWEVDFSTDTALNYPVKSMISIASDKLVVGLANGWAGDGKFLLVYPQDVRVYSLFYLW